VPSCYGHGHSRRRIFLPQNGIPFSSPVCSSLPLTAVIRSRKRPSSVDTVPSRWPTTARNDGILPGSWSRPTTAMFLRAVTVPSFGGSVLTLRCSPPKGPSSVGGPPLPCLLKTSFCMTPRRPSQRPTRRRQRHIAEPRLSKQHGSPLDNLSNPLLMLFSKLVSLFPRSTIFLSLL
jgi:hypothetical protein